MIEDYIAVFSGKLCTIIGALVFCGAVASPAGAVDDLQKVRNHKNGVVYIQGASLQRQEDISRVWTVWDLPSEQLNLHEEPYRSARLLNEYNCRDKTMRLVEIVEYSGERGRGELVRSYDASDAEPRAIPPDTVGADVYDMVCSQKTRDF